MAGALCEGVPENDALAPTASEPVFAVTKAPETAELPSPCSVTCSHHVDPPAKVSSSVVSASGLVAELESVAYLRYRLYSHSLEESAS